MRALWSELLIGLMSDMRTCMPYAVNGSCGLVYLSGWSARMAALKRSTVLTAADTNRLRAVFMMLFLSLYGTQFGLAGKSRFAEELRLGKSFFRRDTKISAILVSSGPMSPEELFQENLPLIERVIAGICRRSGHRDADAEDFGSIVKLALIENDYAILRGYEGRAPLGAFLAVVVQRLLTREWVRQIGRASCRER